MSTTSAREEAFLDTLDEIRVNDEQLAVSDIRQLARIIHQPKKPTKESALGSRMMLKTAVSQRIIILKQAHQVVLALY